MLNRMQIDENQVIVERSAQDIEILVAWTEPERKAKLDVLVKIGVEVGEGRR